MSHVGRLTNFTERWMVSIKSLIDFMVTTDVPTMSIEEEFGYECPRDSGSQSLLLLLATHSQVSIPGEVALVIRTRAVQARAQACPFSMRHRYFR